jgi:hypothetical protein
MLPAARVQRLSLTLDMPRAIEWPCETKSPQPGAPHGEPRPTGVCLPCLVRQLPFGPDQ